MSRSRARSKTARRLNRSSKGLYLIGVYKLVEGALLAVAGLGLTRLLHHDLETALLHWVHVLRIDPENHYIHTFLEKAFALNPRQLRELSIGTFVYAALRLLEGTGLITGKAWGEYLTVIVTALFIPLEVYELWRHFTVVKLVVLITNAAIVIYLARALKQRYVSA